MDLPQEKRFHFRDGSSARSLNELKEKIEHMSYEEFYSHVTESKNDFANWIRYVMKDEHLADDLQLVKSIVETVEIINDYLYPGMADKHLDTLDDLQSHIESEVFHIDKFDEGEASHDANDTQESAEWEPESVDIETDDAMEEDGMSEDETATAIAAEAPSFEQPLAEERTELSRHYKVDNAERSELHEFHHDVGKLIVKDFIMGMFVGLIIGVILGKMLTMF